ncbi:MAG: recombinase family protein [Deltaproteobacteria bacterium]|nr:recombinase family protein [Deltaproteobacteria bacterium]
MDIEKEGREQDNQDIKEKEKERFNKWLGQKLGPDGRRVTLLLTGEDARLWDSLKQESESNNDLIRRLLRTAANDPGGDVQFELKHMVTEVLAGVTEIRAGIQSVAGKLDAGIDARQQTGFDACVDAIDSLAAYDNIDANIGATVDTPLDVKLDAERDDDTKSLAVADSRIFDGKFHATKDTGFDIKRDAIVYEPETQEASSAQPEPFEPTEPQEPSEPIAIETPATDDTTQGADESQEPTEQPTPPVAEIDDTRTLAEIKARLTTKESRKQVMADALLPLIASWAAKGVPQTEIAKRLNDAGIPTAHKGGTWNQSTVSGLLTRAKKAGSK